MLNLFLLFFVSTAFCSDLDQLFKKYDKDQDKKITVEDKIPSDSGYLWKGHEVRGTYFLSNLAQELKYQEVTGRPVNRQDVFENPVDRLSRLIKERFWDGLTRRIDSSTLGEVIQDTKTKSSKYYLYLPPDDTVAINHYKNVKSKNAEILLLPDSIPEDKHGLLSLALKDGHGVPYVVPGGRFNEMYGWDSYFHTRGVLIDGRPDLAKGMVDNFVYEIQHYGKILNANRTYYLTRSQPPFLTSMIRDVYKVLPENQKSKSWLAGALKAAIKEYESVWMGKERLTPMGLSRYAGFAPGIPPEVESGHFNEVLKPYAKKHKLKIPQLIKAFNSGKIKDPELQYFFLQDRAVRESGHDTTYRWRVEGKDRASDFVTVDLNSLLYKYETDIALMIKDHFSDSFEGYSSKIFLRKASDRKNLMMKYLWNSKQKMFFDYNWVNKRQSSYLSATTFYPLWAGMVTGEDAKGLVASALKSLEQPGGLSATSEASLKEFGDPVHERQWEYPNGWAPHQILAWEGLKENGLEVDAHRLIYKWLFVITRNAMDYHGTVPEKFNVVTKSHKVFSEYGNVGTTFSYITLEGFGWMNASYQLGLRWLPPHLLKQLRKMTPPEQVKFQEE